MAILSDPSLSSNLFLVVDCARGRFLRLIFYFCLIFTDGVHGSISEVQRVLPIFDLPSLSPLRLRVAVKGGFPDLPHILSENYVHLCLQLPPTGPQVEVFFFRRPWSFLGPSRGSPFSVPFSPRRAVVDHFDSCSGDGFSYTDHCKGFSSGPSRTLQNPGHLTNGDFDFQALHALFPPS